MGTSTSIADDQDARDSQSGSWTVRLLVGLISSLPRFCVAPAAGGLAWLYRTVAPRKLRRARANLELALGDELSARQLDRLARASILNQAETLIDTVREVRRPGSVTIVGGDEFARKLVAAEGGEGAHDRGQIMISAHLGAWELLNRAGTEATTGDFFALAKRLDATTGNDLLDAVRQRAGTRVLPSTAKSTLKSMVTVLRAGGWLGLVMDQRPQGPGIPVRFFGRRTDFVAGPARLIESQGCGVLMAFCVRTGRGRYRLLAEELAFEAGASRQSITQYLAAELEAVIRRYPEQWLWTYRRWPGPPRPGMGDGVTGDG